MVAFGNTANAVTAEYRHCLVLKSDELVRTAPFDDARDWQISLEKGTEVAIYDHRVDPKTKIEWAFVIGSGDLQGWVKRSTLKCHD
jgi:hypothetical protein